MTDVRLRPASAPLAVEPPDDPFGGFFAPDGGMPSPERLVDIPAAHAWFDLIGWGVEQGLYTFQTPLEAKAGPRVRAAGRSMLLLSSYDYLGLIGHPSITAAATEAIRQFGTGTGGVRLLTGSTTLHHALEARIARFLGAPAAVTFSSGYAANLAVIPALAGPSDCAVVDERVHRSIIEACRLAGVRVRRFAHNDPSALRRALIRCGTARRVFILVEGVYSMDGDLCPLPDIVQLKQEFDAFLLVDEAHSIGMVGATGRGVAEHFGLPRECADVWIGSLSKAIPANGGFAAGSRALAVYLQHGASQFMFSAALCPAATAAALAALDVIDNEPHRLQTLQNNAARLRAGLHALGYDIGRSDTALVPVVFGAEEAAFRAARRLRDLGILATAVVHPAVARGAARLRLCATAAHSARDLSDALGAFAALRAGTTELEHARQER